MRARARRFWLIVIAGVIVIVTHLSNCNRERVVIHTQSHHENHDWKLPHSATFRMLECKEHP